MPPADGEGAPAPVVSVRGEATVETEPEIARLLVSVSTRTRDRRDAAERLARRNEECIVLVRSYGPAIEHLGTSRLSVSPELHDRRDEKVRFYRGTVSTALTIGNLAVIGELVGRLLEGELTTVNGPWWDLRPDSPAYRQARVAAVRSAVLKANEYAEALGGRLTGLLELADTGLMAEPPTPRVAEMRGVRAAHEPGAGHEIDLVPQIQVVRASVEARFTMTQPRSLQP